MNRKKIECRPDSERCTVCKCCPHQGNYCCTSCPNKIHSRDGTIWCKENGDALFPREHFEQR